VTSIYGGLGSYSASDVWLKQFPDKKSRQDIMQARQRARYLLWLAFGMLGQQENLSANTSDAQPAWTSKSLSPNEYARPEVQIQIRVNAYQHAGIGHPIGRIMLIPAWIIQFSQGSMPRNQIQRLSKRHHCRQMRFPPPFSCSARSIAIQRFSGTRYVKQVSICTNCNLAYYLPRMTLRGVLSYLRSAVVQVRI